MALPVPLDPARPAARPIAARADAESVVAAVIAMMAELESVLAHETAHLSAGRVREGLTQEARKSELTGGYLRALEGVKANAVALARLAPDGLARLKAAHQRFAETVAANQAVVATARAVSESLVKSLSEELDRAARPQTYGPSAGYGSSPRNAPLVVSRRL